MRPDGVAIYVLVDALGWEILRDRPFLDDILKERHRVETILGYSSATIPTLLTGQYPNGHGHWNLFYRSPGTSPFRWTAPLRLLPRRLREWRGMRKVVKEVSRLLSGYSGYFAIYNLPLDRIAHYDICETADIYRPGGLAPARSIFDLFIEREIDYECYNYHGHTDEQILTLVPQRLRGAGCRLYFLYLSELDAYLHFHVSDSRGVTERLRFYEDGLRRIYQAALERWGYARLYVFSDHGMTPIHSIYDLIPQVGRLGLSVPGDYLPCYDSTMARFWIGSERGEARLTEFLGSLSCGRLLSDGELKQLGIHFDDGRYGDLIFLMNPGVLLCPSDMGRIRVDGMHGFHPVEDPHAHAVFLSSEPLPAPVRHITEVFALLLRDQGVDEPEAVPFERRR